MRVKPLSLTALYYLAFIGLGISSASMGPTLQSLATNTRSTLAVISTLFLARSLGYLAGTLLGGRIYDRVKGHPALGLSLFVMSLTLFAIPTLRSIYLLGAVLFVLGSAEGMLDVGANTMIFWLHGDRVPPYMNGLHAFWGVGTTIAPLVVGRILVATQSITWSYWIFALAIFPIAIVLFFLQSPDPMPRGSSPTAAARSNVPLLFFSGAMVFLYVGAELGFGGWIYTYATQQAVVSPAIAAGINSAFWLGFTISRLLSILVAVRVKPSTILWIDLAGAVVCLALIAVFPTQLWLLWAGSIGTGVFMASVFPTVLNEAQTRMHMTGNATSWFFVAGSLGGMLFPFLIGQVIGPLGPKAAIQAVLFGMVGCVILFLGMSAVMGSPTLPRVDPQKTGDIM